MPIYKCPICSDSLLKRDRTFRCSAGHSFDIAREGYVNLLPVNRKRSRTPGDNAEMIAARSRFLGGGYYKPLAEALLTAVGQCHCLADLGCGEGYFTSAFCGIANEVYGLDISKAAVRSACKRSKASFAVASTRELPFLDATFDVATVIMAPNSADVARILKPQALLCRVTPGQYHLIELRKLAYREVWGQKKPPGHVEQFIHVESTPVRFENRIEGRQLADLVAMTPMQFRTSKDFCYQVSKLDELIVTADFQIDLFRKQ